MVNEQKDVLIIDTAARGHVEAELAYRSPSVRQVYLWPDKVLASDITTPTGLSDFAGFGKDWPTAKTALVRFALEKGIERVLITADDPIGAGMGDDFTEAGILNFAPSGEAAKIESSKLTMKELAEELGVPTAKFESFLVVDPKETITDITLFAIAQDEFPIVLKADGLAAGKGVKICQDVEDLETKLQEFKDAGYLSPDKTVILEEYLEGPEISLHAWCDGKNYVMFPFAMQDHKTIYENDEGPMTGGMGVISPVPGITAEDVEWLGEVFIKPFIEALRAKGHPFKGVMYPSIKLTASGPMLLEVNARPGDPEAPACLPLLESDFVEIVLACAEGRLAEIPKPKWRKAAAVCISLAAKGYPDDAEAGAVITGIHKARRRRHVKLYDYGVKRTSENLRVNSGRVIALHASGRTLNQALRRGYRAAKRIRFDGERPQMRKDIGNHVKTRLFQDRVEIMRRQLAA